MAADIKMVPSKNKFISLDLDLTQNKHSYVSAIWKSKKMKLALLVIATLALVCLSWAMDADNEQKDVKLPGIIKLKR